MSIQKNSFDLRYYQKEAVSAATAPIPGVNRKLIVMATGAGKTIVAAEIIRTLITPGKRALFVAHREELLNQAADKIKSHVPNVVIEVEKANSRATRMTEYDKMSATESSKRLPLVVVGSVQTLHQRRLQEFPADFFDLIIIDEAHHAMATSYLNVIRHFQCGNPRVRTPLIGITATPDRQDGKNLAKLFQRESYRITIEELIIQKFLVRVRGIVAVTETDLTGIGGAGDYDEEKLAEAVDTAERNALVVQTWLLKGSDRKTIIFSASVAHAKRLAELITSHGYTAQAIWGTMPRDERERTLRQFSKGQIQVLVNCAVLLEGYDEPSVDCIVLAKPTRSKTVVSQCIGRGTRLYESKKDVLVIDVRDLDGEQGAGLNDIFGIPKKFDPKGEDMLDASEMIKDIDPALRDRLLDPESLRKVHDLVKQGLQVDDFDVLDRKHYEKIMADMTSLLWRPAADGYVLNVNERDRDGNRIAKRTYRLEQNTFGQWTASVSEGEPGQPGYRRASLKGTAETAKDAFAKWDPVINQRHGNSKIIDATASWNNESATDKQLFTLFGMGKFRTDADVPKSLTRRQASVLIEVANDEGLKFNYRRVPESLRHVRPPYAARGVHFAGRRRKIS